MIELAIKIPKSQIKIRGTKLVFPHPSFNPSEALKSISNEKCSIWFGTPTMYLGMIL